MKWCSRQQQARALNRVSVQGKYGTTSFMQGRHLTLRPSDVPVFALERRCHHGSSGRIAIIGTQVFWRLVYNAHSIGAVVVCVEQRTCDMAKGNTYSCSKTLGVYRAQLHQSICSRAAGLALSDRRRVLCIALNLFRSRVLRVDRRHQRADQGDLLFVIETELARAWVN